MEWSLKIHHLDITSSGDATIIEVNGIPGIGETAKKKAILIDGGKASAGTIIHTYLKDQGINKLDVMVVTHYDMDHYQGIIQLLGMPKNDEDPKPYDEAIIYDLGDPPNTKKYFTKLGQKRKRNGGTDYEKYLKAIKAKELTLKRATKKVNSFDIVVYDGQGRATIPRPPETDFLPPHWLIGKEIIWGNGLDGKEGRGQFASTPPQGAPTLLCIAANKYVQQTDQPLRFISDFKIYDGPKRLKQDDIADGENEDDNAKSLGFLLTFNNFRYYIAGDLESAQEDGFYNPNTTTPQFQPGVMQRLNPNNNTSGRVLVINTSHHGAQTATSRKFIQQIKPDAALISCGPNAKYNHPAQEAINILDGYQNIPFNSIKTSGYRHPLTPPPPPFNPTSYYLTCFFDTSTTPPLTYGGDASITAGDPGHLKPGHILLSVSQAQSQRPVLGQLYRSILAAANQMGQALGKIVPSTNIAEITQIYHAPGAVTAILNGSSTILEAGLKAMAFGSNNGPDDVGVVSAAIKKINQGPIEAAKAAAEVDNGKRINEIGTAADLAIGYSVCNKNSQEIEKATGDGGASQNAAKAAGLAAGTINKYITDQTKRANAAAYAAATALGAVEKGSASLTQATALAITIGCQIAEADANTTSKLVYEATFIAGADKIGAAMAASMAVTAYNPDPEDVYPAVYNALCLSGMAQFPAKNHAQQAKTNATLAQDDLFSFSMVLLDAVNNVSQTHTFNHN